MKTIAIITAAILLAFSTASFSWNYQAHNGAISYSHSSGNGNAWSRAGSAASTYGAPKAGARAGGSGNGQSFGMGWGHSPGHKPMIRFDSYPRR